MSEFPGFEKSAPTSLPQTRSQTEGTSPTSSWDWDFSSFEKLLENHSNNTQHLTETFSSKFEETLTKLLLEHEKKIDTSISKETLEEFKKDFFQNLQKSIQENSQNQVVILQEIKENMEQMEGQNLRESVSVLHRDLNQSFAKLIHLNERIASSLELLEKKGWEKELPEEKISSGGQFSWIDIVFHIFVLLAVVMFFLLVFSPRGH